MTYKKWDIIIVPFPFTDLTTIKRRPALIVSPNEYNSNQDIVIAFITSKLGLEYRIGDYYIQNWSESNLPKPSMIRMKFATINQSIIVKKLGEIEAKDIEHIQKLLIDFFSQ